MSNKLTDERLDKMLEQYFSREPEQFFSVHTENEKRSGEYMKKKLTVAAAVFASFAVAFTGIYAYGRMHNENLMYGVDTSAVSGNGGSSDSDVGYTSSTEPDTEQMQSETMAARSSLFLRAYGQDVTEADIQKDKEEVGAKDLNNLRQERPDYGKIWYAEDMAYRYSADDESKPIDMVPVEGLTEEEGVIAEPIGFIYVTNIRLYVHGENIDHLSFTSDKDSRIVCYVPGERDLSDPGSAFLDPTNAPYSEYLHINYTGIQSLMYDGVELLNEDPYPSRQEVIDITQKRREAFKDMTAEKYNEYFGDTVTVTVTYTDGSQSVSHIYISFDDDGNYLIDYDE